MTSLDILNKLAPQQVWANDVVEWSRSLWGTPLRLIQTGCNFTASILIVRPLAWLYLEGPIALGFWGGLSPQDICAKLTSTNAQFWNQSPETQLECTHTIERHFWSWLIFGSTVLYFLIFMCILASCFTCWKSYLIAKFKPKRQVLILHAAESAVTDPI